MRSLPNKAVDVIADKLSGNRLILASSTHGSLNLAPACHLRFRLRSLLYDRPRGSVAQRLIDLATHPKSMQQDRQLPRYRYRSSLLGVLSPTLAQPQPVTSQVAVGSKRSQDILRTPHQQLAHHRVPGFANSQLWLALSGVFLLRH